jgi:hypothetical protein
MHDEVTFGRRSSTTKNWLGRLPEKASSDIEKPPGFGRGNASFGEEGP